MTTPPAVSYVYLSLTALHALLLQEEVELCSVLLVSMATTCRQTTLARLHAYHYFSKITGEIRATPAVLIAVIVQARLIPLV